MTDHCPRCGVSLAIGDWPFCPHGRGVAHVVGDEIDLTIEHFGPRPERFRSRARLRQRMRDLKLEPFVRHVGAPGSDKSRYTSRWV
jgi:hypothetical protein